MSAANPHRTTVPATWLNAGWMQTFTGKQFFPLNPDPEQIDPLDIAHALSMLCRYGGHVRRHYSVAEHAYHVSYAVPEKDALHGLLHDATEAYLQDLVRPIKHAIPEYQAIEQQLWEAICVRFDLDPTMPASVKEADTRILLNEREALLAPPPAEWFPDTYVAPLPGVRIHAWPPVEAKFMFQQRLSQLGVK